MPRIKHKRFLRLKLDMVNRCQLRCVMCHFAHPDFQESMDHMSRELLEKIAAEVFPLCHDVVLSSSAEPLMAPELPRALELCREYDVPFFHFSTNALSLTEKIMHQIVEARMPVLTVSCDGATKETFEKVRTPAKWDKFLEKLELVNRIKRDTNSDTPELSMTVVLMRENIEEMPLLLDEMPKRGVQHFNFVHMGVLGGLGMEDQTLARYPELSNRILRECKVLAEQNGVGLTAPLPFPENFSAEIAGTDIKTADEGGGNALVAPELSTIGIAEFLNHKNREFNLKVGDREAHNRMCYFPWYYLHVNPDGTVFPCGHWFEFTVFGDFRTQSFNEIWTGDKFTELRRQIHNLELRKVCANCTASGMGRPDVLSSFSRRDKQRDS